MGGGVRVCDLLKYNTPLEIKFRFDRERNVRRVK